MLNKNQHKRKRPIAILTGIFLLSLSACMHDTEVISLDEMVSGAKENIGIVTLDEFKDIIDHPNKILIVDCRQDNDFLEGHIPGAINVPRGMIGFSDKLTNRRDKIFIYGYNDNCSALAAGVLKKLKFSKVSMIENAWDAWKENYPGMIETGPDTQSDAPEPKVEESGGCGG